MDEKVDQSARVEKLLAKLEALIRNGVPIDVPQAVNRHLAKYEKLTPDERERFVGTMIEAVRGREQYMEPPVAWAVLKELSNRILERHEIPPWRLAQFGLEVIADHTQDKPERGRPPRSATAKLLIVGAHNLLIQEAGFTESQAQRKLSNWIYARPNAVAKIVSEWKSVNI